MTAPFLSKVTLEATHGRWKEVEYLNHHMEGHLPNT